MGSRETAARPLSFSDGRNKGEAMNKIKFMAYLIIIIILGGFSIANSGLQQKNGFSILFPDGWVEVPRDIIDAYQKEMAKLAPNVHAHIMIMLFNWLRLSVGLNIHILLCK